MSERRLAEVRVVGTMLGYSDFIALFRKRVEATGAPHEVLEVVMKLTPGHLGKICGLAEERWLGMEKVWDALEGIGYRLALVEHLDLEATIEEMGHVYRKRLDRATTQGTLRKRVSPAIMTAAARAYGSMGKGKPKTFRHRMTKAQFSRLQRQKARKRWLKAKATRPGYVGTTKLRSRKAVIPPPAIRAPGSTPRA